MTKKNKISDVDKNKILDFLQTMIRREKKEPPLRKKILGFLVGTILVGIGWGYGAMTVANEMGVFNQVTLVGFLKTSLGVSIGFIGFMIVHKGLRGDWV